ncbi:MAG: hypothetical protein ACJAX5_001980 [Patiriisocius sp.]
MTKTGVYALVGATVLSMILSGVGVYLYLFPNITVINNSGKNLSSFVVKLPSNNLDFGALANLEENDIYYTRTQANGHYQLTAIFETGKSISATCGKVKNNENHKRVTITLDNAGELSCTEK